MSDLTNLANLKAWLNLTATSDDGLLQRLITAASATIESWLDRPIAEASFVESRDGTGGRVMSLAVTPVAAIDSLTIDGRTIPSSPDVSVAGYLFGPTRIALIGYRFARGFGNVQIGYTAGYAATPPSRIEAAIAAWWAEHIHNSPIAQATDAYNHLQSVLPHLAQALTKED